MNNYDKQHLLNLQRYLAKIDAIYQAAIKEGVSIGGTIKHVKGDGIFSFDDYPITHKRINELMHQLKDSLQVCIVNGVRSEWTLANNKNNELANRVFGKNKSKLTPQQERWYYSNNDAARVAFEQRKENGLDLSQRVWEYSKQFKQELELGLDVGIRNGRSADEMSRDIRQYLKQPDKLFRRVRDEHGNLKLSQAAKAYHPGQGVYRSSYKNARRLTATETNIAYRTADHLRYQQLDFVVGIEVHLSGNHTLNGKKFHDICDELQGKYPKEFKFTGWHPQCRCYATSILKTPEEIAEDNRRLLRGEPVSDDSVNAVRDVPPAFKQWLADNAERIASAKSLPYFLRDNGTMQDGAYQLNDFGTAQSGAVEPTQTTEQQTEDRKEFNARRGLMQLWDARMEGWLNSEVDLDRISDDIELGDFDIANSRIKTLLAAVERHKARTPDEIRRIQDIADRRKYGQAYVDNVHKIEKALGARRGKRMTHDEANTGRVNPNYGKTGFNTNCSTCSATYILRTMGFNVQAKANIAANPKVRQLSVGMDTWRKWKNGETIFSSTATWMRLKGYKRMNKARYMEFIKEFVTEEGIYEFNIGYKGNTNGHSTLLRRLKDGTIERIEQQAISNATLASLIANLGAIPRSSRGIMRVDTAMFNADWVQIFEVIQ